MARSTATRAAGLALIVLAALAASSTAAEPRLRPLPGTRAEAATLIVQGIGGGPLPLAAVALVGELQAADDPALVRLPLTFEVPAAGLPPEIAQAPTFEFYAYAITPAGAVAAHLGLALEPGSEWLTERSGLKLIATLDLAPGSYSLRLLVLEPVSHRFGLRTIDVTLPGAETAARLTRPAIEDPCSGWLTAATPEAPKPTAAATPVLVHGSRIEFSSSLVGSRIESFAEVTAATVRLVPTSAESSDSQLLPAEVSAHNPTSESRVSLALAFDLPPIARGVYQLSLELGAGSESLSSLPTEVWVVGVGDLGELPTDPCARTWSAVIAQSGGSRGPPAAASADGDISAEARAGRQRLGRAYRKMLQQFAASSDVEAASLDLCELEVELAQVQTGLLALMRVELGVARRLAALEPEVLPPLMLLHHQAYLEHLRRGQFPLAGHSGRVVRELGELVVSLGHGEESRLLASDILTSLAEYGHRSRMLVPSQLLLQRALEMNPGNLDALLLLAVNFEWLGRYDEAATRLEQIVDSAATHSEARLRLAIMRQRQGAASRAERDLRRIAREGAPTWILSLTYQALARLLWRQERYDEALELLIEARSRLGTDQRLQLLEAHVLDRTGRPAEARRVLAQLRIDGPAPTPRYRYGQSLTSPLTSLRDGVAQGVAVRLPLLTRAFEEVASR